MEFIFTCLIVLLILKVVFKVSVSILKIVFGVMIFLIILPIIPFGLILFALALPVIILLILIAVVGFVFKAIF